MAVSKTNKSTFSSVSLEDFHELRLRANSALQSFTTLRLIDCKDELMFYWSESKKILHITDVNESLTNQSAIFKTVIPSVSPLFDVHVLKISLNGHYVLLYGPSGAAVVELPYLNASRKNVSPTKKDTIHTRLVQLDESFFSHHKETKILQVSWYPISQNDKHLVILTNDNCLRFYDLNVPDQPLLRLPLFDHPHHSITAGSISSYASVFGDLAIDFDFAKPSSDLHGSPLCTIYVMQESGDVWLVRCRFSHSRLQVTQQGPLTMNPSSEDNYGCNYCSLVCLQSEPPILAMATCAGRIHHCLVLDTDKDDGFSELPAGDEDMNTEALYVYETVQLDFYHSQQSDENPEEVLQMPDLVLQKDARDKMSYVTACSGGVHFVTLPWIKDLKNIFKNEIQYDENDPIKLETPAEISYLLCTRPIENGPSTKLCGMGITRRNSVGYPSLLCLMVSGEILTLNLTKNKAWEDSKHNQDSNNKLHSPLRSLRGFGNFADFINKILTRNTTLPRIRTDGGNDLVPIDTYYRLLTTTTHIIREEYLQKMIRAKHEYEKRCNILKLKKEEQGEEIERLKNYLSHNENKENIAYKLETAQGKTSVLLDRIGTLFRNIQSCCPTMSTEEMKWSGELKTLEERMRGLKRSVEVVKTKHENYILQELPQCSVSKKKLHQGSGGLTASQTIKVRAVLKDQESVISKLVEDVEQLQVHVGS